MAQTIINNGNSGLICRNAINNNFTELYPLLASTSKIVDANSPYTASYGEVIFVTTTSAITINLPAASSNKPEIIIRHALGSIGTLTLDGNGAEEIEDNVSSTTTKTLSVGSSVRLDSDGTKFHIT